MARYHMDARGAAPIHAEVLAAAQRLCRGPDRTFSPRDVVRALPHLNESSVRTHVVSRCCENAPKNHKHRRPYFRRVGRGVYEILPGFRHAETVPSPTPAESTGARSAIHAAVSESEGWYVAECLEVAVATQGRSLDETLANLKDALNLHLDDEEVARAGLSPEPRLVVSYETSALAARCPG